MARQGLDREAVLQAAAAMADERGFEQVTLAALAERLKVKTPSLYNHIESLKGLRHQLALYALSRLQEQMLYAALGKAGEEAVFAVGLAYVAFVRAHPGLYDATIAGMTYGEADVAAAAGKAVELLLPILDGLGLRGEEALHAVRGFRSLMHGFASIEASGGFRMALDRDESLRHMLRTYLTGLRSLGG